MDADFENRHCVMRNTVAVKIAEFLQMKKNGYEISLTF